MRRSLSEEEKAFLRQLGGRIAELRKARGLTQAQLADRLDVGQQQVASFEAGRRRVPVSQLAPLADALGVSIEELLGTQPKAKRRGPPPKLERHFQRIAQLPRARQKFVLEVLDSVLQQP
jgi:transcriptional regulator with XRE-family HTH domain